MAGAIIKGSMRAMLSALLKTVERCRSMAMASPSTSSTPTVRNV